MIPKHNLTICETEPLSNRWQHSTSVYLSIVTPNVKPSLTGNKKNIEIVWNSVLIVSEWIIGYFTTQLLPLMNSKNVVVGMKYVLFNIKFLACFVFWLCCNLHGHRNAWAAHCHFSVYINTNLWQEVHLMHLAPARLRTSTSGWNA